MSLPTYEASVKGPDKLALVAPYLDRVSLLAACLVSKEWHVVFAAELWSNPIKLTAQTRRPFAKTNLFFTRSSTLAEDRRNSVITLDFRPLKPFLTSFSLRQDIIKHNHVMTPKYAMQFMPFFSNVRCLIMDSSGHYDLEGQQERPPGNNKLLLFSFTDIPILDHNLFFSTPILDNIMFMDISYTINAQAWRALFSLRSLDNLRILKLRGLRLTDETLPLLHMWLRLWSLDLRENYLTDQVIPFLLEKCFAPNAPVNKDLKVDSEEWLYEDPPTYHQRDETDSSDPSYNGETFLRPDAVDSFTRYMKRFGDLSSSSSMILTERDAMLQSTGLTNLYLSSNKFTARGIHKLLSSTNRLQVFDVGSGRMHNHNLPNTTQYCQPHTAHLLDRRTGARINHLRIHHSLVTCIPTIVQGRLHDGYMPKHLPTAEKFNIHDTHTAAFNPLMNYRLTSLALTDIPVKSTGTTITRLITFLRACAKQEAILSAAASGPRTRHSPRLLPGLRRLRLEFLYEKSSADDIGPSVSGDQDADVFTEQSQEDFSFFADEKISSPVTSSRRGSVMSSKSSVAEGVELKDVVEELKIFRRSDEMPKWTGKLELFVPTRL